MKQRPLKAPLRIDFAGGWIDLPDFSKLFQGHVVNVAISPQIKLINGKVDFSPYKAGGGISSSTGALILGQLHLMSQYSSQNKIHSTPAEFAETIFQLENHMIDFKIGRQDQYGIALGGLNCLRFGADEYHRHDFEVETHVSERTPNLQELESSLLLVHSGIQRPAQNIVEAVRRNIANRDPVHIKALKKIANCGTRAAQAVQAQEYSQLAQIMSDNWEAQKQFASECTNPEIDRLYQTMLKNGAIGGKMCGAGGGGYFVFYCNNQKRVKQKAKELGLQTISPKFEMKNILTLNDLVPHGN